MTSMATPGSAPLTADQNARRRSVGSSLVLVKSTRHRGCRSHPLAMNLPTWIPWGCSTPEFRPTQFRRGIPSHEVPRVFPPLHPNRRPATMSLRHLALAILLGLTLAGCALLDLP